MRNLFLGIVVLFAASCAAVRTDEVRLEVRRHSFFLEGEKAAVIQPYFSGIDNARAHELLSRVGYSVLPGKIVKAPYERGGTAGEMERSTIYRLSRQSGAQYALYVSGAYSAKNVTPENDIYPDYAAAEKNKGYGRTVFIHSEIELIRLRDLKTVDTGSYDHAFQTAPIFDADDADDWDREMALRGLTAAFKEYCEYLKGETNISTRKIFL